MSIQELLPLWIAGKPVATSTTFDDHCPYSGKVICKVAVAGDAEIEAAVASAVSAQKPWAKTPAKERARVLQRAASLLREQNDELAAIETLDTGRVIRETSAVDIVSAADCLDYIAALVAVRSSRHVELGRDTFAYTLQKPLGVCLGIGAWNYPLQVAVWKAAPALACGNAFIFKPSEMTPISAYRLGEIFQRAGLPDGLFTVLQGHGDVGAKLVAHPEIKKVSLTGSVPTGTRIYEACAKNLKKLSLELGGKSPLIIFDDANLDDAVHAAMLANFYSQGEICSNGTRVFVHEAIKAQFEAKLARAAGSLKIGDPSDSTSQIGPLISPEHKRKVMGFVATGRAEGARLLFGGDELEGNFVAPTAFTDCADAMTICREEIFGPVMSILSFASEDEVVERANATEFGLAGGVFTADIKRAHRVAQSLEVGICWINNYNITPIEVPFGGAKMSGLGSENGHEVLAGYTQTQTVYVEGATDPIGF